MKKFFVFVLVMFAAILANGQGAAFTFISNSHKELSESELHMEQRVIDITEYGVTVYDSSFQVLERYYLAGPITMDAIPLTKNGVKYTLRIFYDGSCISYITIIREQYDGVRTVRGTLYNK